jgi:hypothetical protein
VLVVVKGLLPLNTIENSWMGWFGLQKNPQLVFPSQKNIIEEVLFCMMKRTLEELFCLMSMLYFLSQQHLAFGSTNVHLIILLLWFIFNIGLGIETCHNWCIWSKNLLKLILLVNCKLCLKNTSWLTKLFAMWRMKAQIYLQWHMFLNKLSIVKNWGYWHHLIVCFGHALFKLANMHLWWEVNFRSTTND